MNNSESSLSLSSVGGLQRIFQIHLPAAADGAPVALSSVSTPAGVQDLIFITTRDGQALALNAHSGAQVWSRTFGANGCTINRGSTPCYTTSSPAIDPSRAFVYTYGLDGYAHKLAVGDGTEVTTGGWPQLVTTKPWDEKGSSALGIATAADGSSYLYVTSAGYPGDNGDYQGHVTAIRLSDGSQRVYNTLCSNQAVHFVHSPGTPDCGAVQSAVWGRPGVVFSSALQRIFFAVGNGNYAPGAFEWGDSVLALPPDASSAGGEPQDSYTPTNFQQLQNNDTDVGSVAPVLVPAPAGSSVTHLAVQGGKDAQLRLLNLDNLSGQGGPGRTGGELGVFAVPQGGEVLPQPAVWTAPGGQVWLFVATGNGLSGLQVVAGSGGVPKLVPQWTLNTASTSPLVANGVLYYASSGSLTAADPLTGTSHWHDATIGGVHWQSPVVAGGILLMEDNSGQLSAFALPTAAKFEAHVNFQTATTATPSGYLPDWGLVFGNRGQGLQYGWNQDNTATARERNNAQSPDKRYDTLLHLQKPTNPNASWSIAVPNGNYRVHVVAGDPNFLDSFFDLVVDGVEVLKGAPSASQHWVEGVQNVTATQGRLTLVNGALGRNDKVCFIDITQL